MRPAGSIAAPAMLLWALPCGVAGALAAVGFKEAIHSLQWLMTGQSGSLVEMARRLPWGARLLLPALGGLLAGWLLVLAGRHARPGVSDYMEVVSVGDGQVPVRHSLLRCLSSLATIASGGSIGREGPMAQLAALCGSLLGRLLRLERNRLRLLVACGAAAGLAAAYNAPVAAAFFIAEIVLGTTRMRALGPVLLAATVSNLVMRELGDYQPTYVIPGFPVVHGLEQLLFVLLGLIAGIVAPAFLHVIQCFKSGFRRCGWPLPWRLAVGGLMVGAISVWVPQVWGNGYSVVNALLHQPWTGAALLLVLACKILATACTSGSGAVGGVFTPTLFVGAAVGYLVGLLAAQWAPGIASAPFAYAIVGMGATLAAATGAPIMAMLMMFEMTLSYQVLLPLSLACVVAYFVAQRFQALSMYEVLVHRNRQHLERDLLRNAFAGSLVVPAETVVALDAPLREMADLFMAFPVKYVYVVDAHHRYQGTVSLRDIAYGTADRPQAGSARDLVGRGQVSPVPASASLEQALACFLTHQGERLPVVDADGILLGVLTKTALLDIQMRLDDQLSGWH